MAIVAVAAVVAVLMSGGLGWATYRVRTRNVRAVERVVRTTARRADRRVITLDEVVSQARCTDDQRESRIVLDLDRRYDLMWQASRPRVRRHAVVRFELASAARQVAA